MESRLRNERREKVTFVARAPLCTLMTGIGLAVGLIVPTVYEWSQKPVARSRHPEMDRAAVIVIVFTLVFSAILWSLKLPPGLTEEAGLPRTSKPFQFGIRHILTVMSVVAVFISVSPMIQPVLVSWAPWAVISVAVGLLVWSFFLGPAVRSRFAALLASMFLPFVWIVPVSEPFGHVSGILSAISFGPGLMPAMLMRTGNIDNSIWIAAVVVILELVLGFWLARRTGIIPVTVYIILILLVSATNSLLVHALYRM